MTIGIEPVYDPFGGMQSYISGVRKYSRYSVREVPSWSTRLLLNRSRRLKIAYQNSLLRRGVGHFGALHSMSDPWFIDVCRISRSSACKWVHTYHVMFFEEDYKAGLEIWQKKINHSLIHTASQADVKITTSTWFHDFLRDQYSINTIIIPGGVDVALCDEANPNRFSSKYKLRDYILFVGSIREVKEPSAFIALARELKKEQFVMIGAGLNEATINHKYQIDIPPNLIAMGHLRRREVLDAISAAKMLVVTSKHEGFPQVVLEAMCMAKPTVISSYVGARDIIPSDEFGYVYEKGSITDLVDKTRTALQSPHVGDKARQMIREKFDWKHLISLIDNCYG